MKDHGVLFKDEKAFFGGPPLYDLGRDEEVHVMGGLDGEKGQAGKSQEPPHPLLMILFIILYGIALFMFTMWLVGAAHAAEIDPNSPYDPNIAEIDPGLWQVLQASKLPPDPNVKPVVPDFQIVLITPQVTPQESLSTAQVFMVAWYEGSTGERFANEIYRNWLQPGPTDLNRDGRTNYPDLNLYLRLLHHMKKADSRPRQKGKA